MENKVKLVENEVKICEKTGNRYMFYSVCGHMIIHNDNSDLWGDMYTENCYECE